MLYGHRFVKSPKTQWKKVSVIALEVCSIVGRRKKSSPLDFVNP